MKADYVGQPQEGKWQVFHRGYNVDLPNRRRPAIRTYRKPWSVDCEGERLRKFRTHAKAVAWASRKVWEGRK